MFEDLSWILYGDHPSSQNDCQTDMTETITFRQLRWWAVNMTETFGQKDRERDTDAGTINVLLHHLLIKVMLP